ncbi:MAG TPA: sigma 54-interacting transcriptional regulator [Planctomycetaceae bacterium]|nr:sigma 54-interacting transcriptional regulator [Planctomycetaceae bacterium]
MAGDAFLTVKNGPLEGRQYRLIPGQITTLGRAPTNRIPVPDEVCSRNHCEVFQSAGRWLIRDLGSRNGTKVQGQVIDGDCALHPGQLIQLGSTVLSYTLDSRAQPTPPGRDPLEPDTATEMTIAGAQPEIVHRTHQSSYRSAEIHQRDRMGRDLARLYKLAMEMSASTDVVELAETVLNGILASTPANIGAVLMLSDPTKDSPSSADLQTVAYKSRIPMPYQRVSDSLSQVTLSERDAILARDVLDDDRLKKKESFEEISVESVICAPVRSGDQLFGLVHLYSSDITQPLEPDDLDFTLAVADQFALAVENIQRREQLAAGLERAKTENQTLREQLRVETELVGESSAITRLRDRLSRIAPTGATVLIRGESGVGKELVARAIHMNSARRSGPFVTMNCAALSESLLESELFGHEKGSFTGAVNRKIGKFEQAHQGTLFLDEVGEMSLAIQAKFLRVLEGHPFERVGGGTTVQVDVRVVAATNRALEEAVGEGQFRKDLYFRLQVVELNVEPLRARRSDIPLLAQYFLDKFARKIGRPAMEFSADAIELLRNYDWPGNVRELQNTIERAIILALGPQIEAHDIQLSTLGRTAGKDTATLSVMNPGDDFQPQSLEDLERRHILATLHSTGGNKSQAAQILGIERSTLDRKLKRYESERHDGP